jgi:hypothetical protein
MFFLGKINLLTNIVANFEKFIKEAYEKEKFKRFDFRSICRFIHDELRSVERR